MSDSLPCPALPGVAVGVPVILQTAVGMAEGSGPAVQVLGLDLLAEADQRGFRLTQRADGKPL